MAEQQGRIPADDSRRRLAVASPDTDQALPHLGIAGDTYTLLLTGKETAGRYCLIDMHVPPGGGPPPHRHDFEETFTVLEGQLEFVFRDETVAAGAGTTVHIPANAPHQFRNAGKEAARMLCTCSPAGQEEFFLEVAVPVATRTTPPPPLDAQAQKELKEKSGRLAAKYRTEFL
jgi:quercetin dioxygenase-like cupin family protein